MNSSTGPSKIPAVIVAVKICLLIHKTSVTPVTKFYAGYKLNIEAYGQYIPIPYNVVLAFQPETALFFYTFFRAELYQILICETLGTDKAPGKV